MILLDYSQVVLASLLSQVNKVKLDEDLLRHQVLNSIRAYNMKFNQDYGRMVIACDNKQYWRKSEFPNYKFKRKRDREESGLDWHMIFDMLHRVKQEIADTFPYKVMDVAFAEADDVIGVLTRQFAGTEPIMIVSGDKDFQQLQRYPGVHQYSPNLKREVDCPDPETFLREHIMRGDSGDSIPNFLSVDDVFVKETKQKPVFAAKIDLWLKQAPEEYCDETMLRHYRRNEKLVDLRCIPDNVQQAILAEFERPIKGDRSRIFNYMIKHRLRNLFEVIHEF